MDAHRWRCITAPPDEPIFLSAADGAEGVDDSESAASVEPPLHIAGSWIFLGVDAWRCGGGTTSNCCGGATS